VEKDDTLFLSVKIGSWTHTASYPMDCKGSFPEGKATGAIKLTTNFHPVLSLQKEWCYVLIKHRDDFTCIFTFPA
jgi:hypothetical protein